MLHHIVPEGREPSPPVSRYLRPVISVGLRDVRVAPGSGKCRALAFEGGERSVLGQRGSVVLGLPWSRLSLQVGVPCVGHAGRPAGEAAVHAPPTRAWFGGPVAQGPRRRA